MLGMSGLDLGNKAVLTLAVFLDTMKSMIGGSEKLDTGLCRRVTSPGKREDHVILAFWARKGLVLIFMGCQKHTFPLAVSELTRGGSPWETRRFARQRDGPLCGRVVCQ